MKTVTRGPWNVSSISGSGITGVEFQPFRVFTVNGNQRKYLYPSCYGKQFANQDEATAFAVEQGFSQIWYPRPHGFIDLRLPPRTRKYLKKLKGDERWNALEKLLVASDLSPQTCKMWLRAVRNGTASRKQEWDDYMDGKFRKAKR